MPETSIIVRAFNEQRYIGSVFEAIEKQAYDDYEVLLVDSYSTDRTVEIAEKHCDRILNVHPRDFTFGHSLNVGCEAARGQYLVMVSAHAIPASDAWLGSLVRHLKDDSGVAMVYGRHVGADVTKFSEKRDFARLFDGTPKRVLGLDTYSNNANSAIRKTLWDKHPFDEYLTGLEDIAWARFFADLGYAVVYEPEAAVYHIHDETWARIYNRYRREAVAARRIGLREPPHGSTGMGWMVRHLAGDALASLREPSVRRFYEVWRFRYHQWKGTRDGWLHDIDLERERRELFYGSANQGVVISGPRQAAFQDVPMPEVKPGDVCVRVAYVGICRTDLEIFDGHLGYYRNGTAKYPIVPGHEYSGEVVQVGANHNGIREGDRVVGECIMPCGHCEWCRAGRPSACASRQEIGVVGANGAYARYVVVPTKHVHVVPPDLSLRAACLAEPLAVVRRGLTRIASRLASSSRIAVVGAGPIGNLASQALALEGHSVTAFDRNEARLALLPEGIARGAKLEGLDRFDVVVEASGNADALRHVLTETRADATILLLGFPYGDMTFNFESVVAGDRVIVGSVGGRSEDFRWALQTLPRLQLDAFLASIHRLEEFERAWDVLRSGQAFKTILQVGGESA